MRRGRTSGFTLLELLVVVAIIAIIAAIAVMSYLTAMDKGRQKKTMNDIRMIASAWEARAADAETYVVAGYSFPGTEVPFDAMSAALTPTYIRQMPIADGWGTPWNFGVGNQPKDYAIRSAGRNRQFESNTYTPGQVEDMDCDIVFAAGGFVQYPLR